MADHFDASTVKLASDHVVAGISRRLDKRSRPVLVGIDGRSGTGKSTLAQLVASRTGASVVVVDDFYAGGSDDQWLTKDVRERTDQVLDWRRLREQALVPLQSRRSASWHPLDFEPGVGWVGWKQDTVTVAPADVVLVEGAFSTRPELLDLIDLTVLVEAPEAVRRERLQHREGEDMIRRWHALWDGAENFYFSLVRPPDSFDLMVRGG